MEGYFKRFFIGHFLILMIAAGVGLYFGLSTISIITFVLLLEFLIYFLDVKYLSKRKTELANKLIKVFKAEPVTEGVMKFKIDTFDFYAEIEIDLKLGISQIANVEVVKFHIPRNQIDQLPVKPKFEFKEDKIHEIQTYNIYQTDDTALRHAKENLEKMIGNFKTIANNKK